MTCCAVKQLRLTNVSDGARKMIVPLARLLRMQVQLTHVCSDFRCQFIFHLCEMSIQILLQLSNACAPNSHMCPIQGPSAQQRDTHGSQDQTIFGALHNAMLKLWSGDNKESRMRPYDMSCLSRRMVLEMWSEICRNQEYRK